MALTEEQRAKLNAKAKQKTQDSTSHSVQSQPVEKASGGMNRKQLTRLAICLVAVCVLYAVFRGGLFLKQEPSVNQSVTEGTVQEPVIEAEESVDVTEPSEQEMTEQPVEQKILSIGDTVDYYGKEITLVDAYRADPNSKFCEYIDEGWADYFLVFECVNNTKDDWIIHNGFVPVINYDDYNTFLTSPRIKGVWGTINGERPWDAELPPGKSTRGYMCIELLSDFERLELKYDDESFVLYNSDLDIRDVVIINE